MDQLYDRVVSILTDEFDVPADRVSADVSFEALELDSLDLVELLLIVDEQLGVKIEDEEAQNLVTVGSAVKVIAEKLEVAA